jgi:hypothetical protein
MGFTAVIERALREGVSRPRARVRFLRGSPHSPDCIRRFAISPILAADRFAPERPATAVRPVDPMHHTLVLGVAISVI